MSRVKGIAARLRSVLRPGDAERRMEEEFAFHVEMEMERLKAEGLSADDARQRALARFGGRQGYREEMREERRARWYDDLNADLRYGARMLRKNKGLTLVALTSLALGIGANAAVFSVVNSILLRPRPVSNPEQLVQLYAGDERQPFQTISYPSYVDFRVRNEVFSGLAAYGVGYQFRLGGANEVTLLWGEVVTGNYFDVLGVRPDVGRAFLPEEDQVPSRNPVVVIGYGLWQRRFAADSGVIGRAIRLNGQPMTVIGIAPQQFTGMTTGWATEIWVPTMMIPSLEHSNGERMLTSRGSSWLTLIGRLKPGTTIDQARRRFEVLAGVMRLEHPGEWREEREEGRMPATGKSVSVLTEQETRVHPTLRGLAYAVAALVFVVVNLVLVIACLNLASILLARGVARRTEIAVRLALGARRSRIIRQLLTESVLLSIIAGAAGIILAYWVLDALVAFMPALPEGIRVALDIRLDWRVVAYTIAFSTITGILFGFAPALASSRSAVSSVLKDDAAAFSAPLQASLVRRSLIVAQVALSLLLLIGAGLTLRSLEKVRPARMGFTSDNLVVASLALEEATYTRETSHRFYQDLSGAVSALPGVQAVSLVEGVPGGFMSRSRASTEIEGYEPRAGESLEIDVNIVGPRYFTNMQMPVVLGRDFDDRDRDGAACTAIINEVFAQRYLGGSAQALGKHLARPGVGPNDQKRWCEIVGVIRDNAWQSLQREARPFYALPLLQSDRRRMTLLVSTAGDPGILVPVVRRSILAIDPNMPVGDVQTLADHFSVGLYPFRLLGLVFGGCGLMALLLATIGIYGTVAYSVAQRRREVGIRMALGALRTDILRLVVRQGMVLVAYGLGLGLLLGAALTRVLTTLPLDTPLLFGVSATDVATFAGVTILLGLVSLAACYVPARRATEVDPVLTLRSS